MLEFVDSDLYFVQDNVINPLLHVGSGSGFVEKSTGSGSSSLLKSLVFSKYSWYLAGMRIRHFLHESGSPGKPNQRIPPDPDSRPGYLPMSGWRPDDSRLWGLRPSIGLRKTIISLWNHKKILYIVFTCKKWNNKKVKDQTFATWY